jgi:hypothetical protein
MRKGVLQLVLWPGKQGTAAVQVALTSQSGMLTMRAEHAASTHLRVETKEQQNNQQLNI